MPRRRNDKEVLIYWLLDMRAETIAGGWHSGKPFYCGKTVQKAEIRLNGHRSDAKRNLHRATSKMVSTCGDFIKIMVMRTVSSSENWIEREKFWISQLRVVNPNCTNIADGGQGMTGYVTSESTKQKQRNAALGRKVSPETCAKIRRAKIGTSLGPEARRKLSEINKGKFVSEETREKMRQINTGKRHGPEARAKMSAAKRGKRKPLSEETKRKIGQANRGRKRSCQPDPIRDANASLHASALL